MTYSHFTRGAVRNVTKLIRLLTSLQVALLERAKAVHTKSIQRDVVVTFKAAFKKKREMHEQQVMYKQIIDDATTQLNRANKATDAAFNHAYAVQAAAGVELSNLRNN
jgi:hypothetical protein